VSDCFSTHLKIATIIALGIYALLFARQCDLWRKNKMCSQRESTCCRSTVFIVTYNGHLGLSKRNEKLLKPLLKERSGFKTGSSRLNVGFERVCGEDEIQTT
jgi:hypothetical protein